jgi:hypothetical protein
MMGERRVMQEALFYGFSLERHVPEDHLLRKIDRFVEFARSGRALLRPQTLRPPPSRVGHDPNALIQVRDYLAAVAEALAQSIREDFRRLCHTQLTSSAARASVAQQKRQRPDRRTTSESSI